MQDQPLNKEAFNNPPREGKCEYIRPSLALANATGLPIHCTYNMPCDLHPSQVEDAVFYLDRDGRHRLFNVLLHLNPGKGLEIFEPIARRQVQYVLCGITSGFTPEDIDAFESGRRYSGDEHDPLRRIVPHMPGFRGYIPSVDNFHRICEHYGVDPRTLGIFRKTPRQPKRAPKHYSAYPLVFALLALLAVLAHC